MKGNYAISPRFLDSSVCYDHRIIGRPASSLGAWASSDNTGMLLLPVLEQVEQDPD